MELNINIEDVLKLVPDKSILPEIYGRRIGFSKPTYPGFYHVHHLNDYSVKYMDLQTCKEFNASLEEIKALGASFQELVTHPDDLPRVKALLKTIREQNSDSESFTYFQRIKLRTVDKEGYTLIITSVKLNLEDQTYCCISNTTDQLPVFTRKISNALNSRYEVRKLINAYIRLTNREKEVFELLAKNHQTKEIAKLLSRSVRTIEQHRKNIYRKFQITSLAELINAAYQLNHS